MKKLVLLTLLVATLFADILDEKIKTLVDTNTYLRHQRLIDVIFREREQFFIKENIDYIKVIETLKSNGLLNIFYPKPKDLSLEFATTISPEIFIKSITDILREMGYSFFVTSYMKKGDLSLKWSIRYVSDHTVDPLLFARKLQAYNMDIHEITKDQNSWRYEIGSVGVSLADARNIDELLLEYPMLDPDGEYWLELWVIAGEITVKSTSIGYWYPRIVFYDKNLQVLKIYENDHSRRSVTLTLPKEAKFIKISDKYSGEDIKQGISVEFEEQKEEQE